MIDGRKGKDCNGKVQSVSVIVREETNASRHILTESVMCKNSEFCMQEFM